MNINTLLTNDYELISRYCFFPLSHTYDSINSMEAIDEDSLLLFHYSLCLHLF